MIKIATLILSSLSLFMLFTCKETVAQTRLVEPQEMKAIVESKDVYLVDVRTSREYNQEYIKNAINIDFNSSNFETELKKLDTTKPVAVYCRSGGRSAASVKTLKTVGFKEIYDLEGGINNWKEQNLEVTKKQ